MAHIEVLFPCPVCRALFDTVAECRSHVDKRHIRPERWAVPDRWKHADMISCRAPGYNEARALLAVTRQELGNESRKEDELLIWPNASNEKRP